MAEPTQDSRDGPSPALLGFPHAEEASMSLTSLGIASPGIASPTTTQPWPEPQQYRKQVYMGVPQTEEHATDRPTDDATGQSPPAQPTYDEAGNKSESTTHEHPVLAAALRRPPRTRTRWKRNLCAGSQGWGYESSSLLFSILCVVAMVVVLAKFDGRLLSTWGLAMSPNAVIAVLSTAAKAAMLLPVAECLSQLKWVHLHYTSFNLEQLVLYDAASRGPWGATSRGPWGATRFLWSGRGATVPTYLGCFVTIAAIALYPFTQQLLAFEQRPTLVPDLRSNVTGSQVYDNQGKGLNGVSSNITPSTRDGPAEAAAIAGLYDLVQPPPFACPGSNCTFPVLGSLGVTNACADVTAKTLKNCSTPEEGRATLQNCTFTLPGNISLVAGATFDAHSGFQHTIIEATVRGFGYEYVHFPTLGQLSILTFDHDAGEGAFDPSTAWQDTMAAWQCTFQIAALAFVNWTSINGTVQPGATLVSRLNLTEGGPIITAEALDTAFPGNRSFAINVYDYENLAGLLDMFDPVISDGNSLNALQNSPNLTATLDHIATALSYRMLVGPNATAVFGDVYTAQIYIVVRWGWLVPSAALILLAALLLVAVAVGSEAADVRVWKSSLTPFVYGREKSWDGMAGDGTVGRRGHG